MMATLTDSDLEIIKLFEFDPDVPCEANGAAGESAVWYLKCRKCEYLAPFCEEHRRSMANEIAAAAARNVSGRVVSTCGIVGATLEHFFTVAPVRPAHIGGAS